jgi:hypothetical protein
VQALTLDRPHAFQVQQHSHTIPEDYIFMMETDHILLHPPPLLATETR